MRLKWWWVARSASTTEDPSRQHALCGCAGWLERMGSGRATFRCAGTGRGRSRVRGHSHTGGPVQRTVIETRILAKLEALQRGHRPVGVVE